MAETNFIEGHVAVLPGEEFSPTEGRVGVFFDPQDLQETLESKKVPEGTKIQTIAVPADAIIRANSKRFVYKPTPDARLLS